MSELGALTRYARLQQLGVTLWVPRKRLPGAAPSQQCDWPQAATQPQAKQRLRAELELAPQQSTGKAEVGAKTAPPAAAVATPATATAVPAVEAAPAQAEPLQADVWMLANGWQLVAERSAHEVLTHEAVTLVQNLIRALYPQPIGLVSQHYFSWPLAGVPLDQGDEKELGLSLAAFLTGAQFQRPPVALLLLGERLPGLLGQVANLPLPEQYAAPSLSQLFQQPALKQTFWQQAGAQGLRARFASSPLLWG